MPTLAHRVLKTLLVGCVCLKTFGCSVLRSVRAAVHALHAHGLQCSQTRAKKAHAVTSQCRHLIIPTTMDARRCLPRQSTGSRGLHHLSPPLHQSPVLMAWLHGGVSGMHACVPAMHGMPALDNLPGSTQLWVHECGTCVVSRREHAV